MDSSSPGSFPVKGGYEFASQFFVRVLMLMKKQWVGNRRKIRFYGEMWGNVVEASKGRSL